MTTQILIELFQRRCVSLACGLILAGNATAWGQAITPLSPLVPDGYQLIEGDILVPKAPLTDFVPAATFPTFTVMYWPGGVVPYVWDGNVSADNQAAMRRAMAVWEGVANVHFRPWRIGDAFWLHIQNSSGNSSTVGRVAPGQTVNILSWDNTYIMAHELGHALGFWHEQSRGDRDAYIQINAANIESGKAFNFDLHNEANHYGPYDFDSVMHYSQYAFSANGLPTITVRPPYGGQWQNRIGQRDHLSTMDAMTMSFLYPQPGWLFVDGSYSGWENGSFLDPYNTFSEGLANVSNGGTIWYQPGNYPSRGTYGTGAQNKAMTWRAPLGSVTFQ